VSGSPKVIFEFRLGGWPIDSLGVFHRDAFDGLALNEETLDRIDRRELIVARLHRRDLIGNAKETPDEILNMRRRVDDEIRLLFGVERRGVRARGDETVVKRGVGFGEMCDERLSTATTPSNCIKLLNVKPIPS